MYSAQTQFEETKFWRGVNLALGLPASLLAAVAGTTALVESTGRVTAGILALLSAGFGTVLTTVNASRKTDQAASAANAYLELQTAARQTREIDLPGLSLTEARKALADLTARRDDQNRTSKVPGRRAYRRARTTIADGGQTYTVDEGDRAAP